MTASPRVQPAAVFPASNPPISEFCLFSACSLGGWMDTDFMAFRGARMGQNGQNGSGKECLEQILSQKAFLHVWYIFRAFLHFRFSWCPDRPQSAQFPVGGPTPPLRGWSKVSLLAPSKSTTCRKVSSIFCILQTSPCRDLSLSILFTECTCPFECCCFCASLHDH